jgi:hypothetical protein
MVRLITIGVPAVFIVEILGHLVWVHNRFQKFLEISKPMCVSPCNMQPKFLAAQR